MLSQVKKSARSLLIAFVLSAPLTVTAQKLEKPVIDKFANDTAYFTTTEKIAATKSSMNQSVENIEFYLSKKKDVVFGHFNLVVTMADHKCYHVTAGNQILLKLADNSIVILSCFDDRQSKRISYGSHFLKTLDWACWSADIPFGLLENDFKKVAASPIVSIRIQTDEQNYDFDIKPKDTATLNKMFQLIVNAR